MSILPTPVVDYTDKDFDSLRVRLYNLLSSVFPEWTDQNVANFGNILVELFSHVANLGDTRSLIIHSASTTHRQLTLEQQEAAGAAPMFDARPVSPARSRPFGAARAAGVLYLAIIVLGLVSEVLLRGPVLAGGADGLNLASALPLRQSLVADALMVMADLGLDISLGSCVAAAQNYYRSSAEQMQKFAA